MEYISKSEEETQKMAANFTKEVSLDGHHQGARVVGLYGELGAGKTQFIKGVAKYFGISETIQSPTFVIMKTYKTSPPNPLSLTRRGGKENENSLGGEVIEHLIHIDAYRIEKSDEMLNLGWNEIITNPQNLIFIEWPERVADIMPDHLKIIFEHISPNERKITIS